MRYKARIYLLIIAGCFLNPPHARSGMGCLDAFLILKEPLKIPSIGDSVFSIEDISGRKGTGFVVDGRFVTDYHVVESFLLGRNWSDVFIKNSVGQRFSIKGVSGVDILMDLAVLEIENYTGPRIGLNISSGKSDFVLMGFPGGDFTAVKLKIKHDGVLGLRFTHDFADRLNGSSGAPILDDEGRGVAMAIGGGREGQDLFGVGANHIRDILDKTPRQAVVDDLIFTSIEEQIKDFRHPIPYEQLAQHRIGNFYYHIMKDYKQAFYWYKLAAEQNHADSAKMLLHMAAELNFENRFEDYGELMEISNLNRNSPVPQEVFSEDSFIDRFFDGAGKIMKEGIDMSEGLMSFLDNAIGQRSTGTQGPPRGSGISSQDWEEAMSEVEEAMKEDPKQSKRQERSERRSGGNAGQAGTNKDYYKILNIRKNANSSDIKKAYRILVQRYHPDKPTGNEAMFRNIQEAYEVLGNPAKRARYDLSR